MKWIHLTNIDQLMEIDQQSFNRPQFIFKHSTRCSISSMILTRLERSNAPEHVDCYILDLIKHRDISNKIAQEYDVYHESPQVLLIKNGECVYDESHYGITMDAVIEQA